MARGRGLILTDATVLGLFYIQRYRFLTIPRFARAAGLHPVTAARQLRALELARILDHFGGIAVPGYGGTPKAYFLTRRGSGLTHEITRRSAWP